MPVVAVVNPKGGVGKTTLATNLAGYFASNAHRTMLGDFDAQQSARHWLGLRPAQAASIATGRFLAELRAGFPRTRRFEQTVSLVGMRVDPRTRAAEQLARFVGGLGLPVSGYLRDTQNYVHLAAHGLTLFDVPPQRVDRDRATWEPLLHWLES